MSTHKKSGMCLFCLWFGNKQRMWEAYGATKKFVVTGTIFLKSSLAQKQFNLQKACMKNVSNER